MMKSSCNDAGGGDPSLLAHVMMLHRPSSRTASASRDCHNISRTSAHASVLGTSVSSRLRASSSSNTSHHRIHSGEAAAAVVDTNLPKEAAPFLNPQRAPLLRRLPTHERRPNTAGLKQHARPWTLDQLQCLVMRNGVGGAVWTCTMREIDTFQKHPPLSAQEDEDPEEDDALDPILHANHKDSLLGQGQERHKRSKLFQRYRTDAATSATAATAAPLGSKGTTTSLNNAHPQELPAVSKLPPTRFSYSEVPKDAPVLKTIRGFTALEDAAHRMQDGGAVCLAQLQSLCEAPENLRSETRSAFGGGGSVSVKVLPRHVLYEKACALYGRDQAVELQQLFKEFACGDSVAVAPLLALCIKQIQHPTVAGIVHIIFATIMGLKTTAHCAELRCAARLVESTAKTLRTSAAASAAAHTSSSHRGSKWRPSSASSSASLSIAAVGSVDFGTRLAAQFSLMVDTMLQPRSMVSTSAAAAAASANDNASSAAGGGTVVVESVSWTELRSTVQADTAWALVGEVFLSV